jgi:hypothetical protein
MVRAKRLAVTALIAVPLTLAFLGALGLVVGALHFNGIDLGAIDPTEQAFTVTIHNDLSEPVVLKQCDTACGPNFHEIDRLAPGASVPVNTSSENSLIGGSFSATMESSSVASIFCTTTRRRMSP